MQEGFEWWGEEAFTKRRRVRIGRKSALQQNGGRTTTVEGCGIESTCTIAHIGDAIQSIRGLMRSRVDGHFRTVRNRGSAGLVGLMSHLATQ